MNNSQLINKSEINSLAAKELHKLNYYCSSVHCSYYSCIQLMMHIIQYKIGYDKTRLSDEFKKYKEANINNRGGLHEYYINLINIHLRERSLDFREFNKQIFILKKTRTDSDYLDIQIGSDESRLSLLKAEDINKIIKKAL